MASFVISKRFSGDYKFEFVSCKAYFTSNAYELRMDCESAVEYLRSVPRYLLTAVNLRLPKVSSLSGS
jgi:uncharacterized protein YegP (UPF0339 family)